MSKKDKETSMTKFFGNITTNKNAIVIDGQDGGHFTIDVPDFCVVGLMALAMARGEIVKMTIEWGEAVDKECRAIEAKSGLRNTGKGDNDG